ncbi:unnamed protein product [Owenia fusiformis]|uniref:Ubiquitin-like protein ATG12 n=1 Tax=Owenia fusiformis TaxID=6347 RepID=A0A8S4PMB0_OWEFU|nr:unnamed protein product [Owenia fusiformis]
MSETPPESENQSGHSFPAPTHTDELSCRPAKLDADKKTKIDVLLKSAGDAPIMKKKKWAVDPTKKIGWVIEFMRKYLKFEPEDSLFLYVNQSFSPSLDVELGTLYDCFSTDGKLVLHYCRTQAWG